MSVLREVAKDLCCPGIECRYPNRCGQCAIEVEMVEPVLAALDRAGWQCVPKASTDAMEDAGNVICTTCCNEGGQMHGIWEAMLAAAPKVEGE